MAKKTSKPAFPPPKRDSSNTKQSKAGSTKGGVKPMKGCKCGGHG